MRRLTIFSAIVAISVGAHAGPLGMEMGTPLQDLQTKVKLKSESQYQYSTPSLPDGHPDFNDYWLLITPKHGLCKITAWTPSISTSVYGTELLSSFNRYFAALSKKYGKGERYDYLARGSIWNEPKDWMMALRKKERSLVAFWISKNLKLPDNLSAIKLEAVAAGTESGAINIGYEFTNSSECIDWIRSQKDSNL